MRRDSIMFILLLMLLGTQQCIALPSPNPSPDAQKIRPEREIKLEPQLGIITHKSQHHSVHNNFPSEWESNFPRHDRRHNSFPSEWGANFPQNPSGHNSISSAWESDHLQDTHQPRNPAPSNKLEHLSLFPPVNFQLQNNPSFKMPSSPSEQFPNPQLQPRALPTFVPLQSQPLPKLAPFEPHAFPTFAPLVNSVNRMQPLHIENPALPPLPPINQDMKSFLEKSEILRQSVQIKQDSIFQDNNNKDPLTPPPLPQLQDQANICENFNGLGMDIPAQLSHLFNTFVRNNVSSDEEETSFWGALTGQHEKKEIIGIEPECSQGRCWCPLLHYYDSSIDRCLHQNSEICNESEFKCTDGKCIDGHMRCDGFINCLDATDEKECSQHSCSSSQFRCGDHTCVDSESSICNSVLDCLDGSDEDNTLCSRDSKTCAENQFQCGDESCIYKDWQCDGFPDCFDASDELDCIMPNCSTNQFQCEDGTCIDAWRKCDFNFDCPDASDEKSCSFCRMSEYRCINSSSVKCVPKDSLCDYKNDCDDGSDEFDCRNRLNTGVFEGSGNVYVDAMLKRINDVVLRRIPNSAKITKFASKYASQHVPGSEVDCILSGVKNGFQRVEDSWINLEYKTLTFTAKIITPPINVRCTGNFYLGNLIDAIKQPEGLSMFEKTAANFVQPGVIGGLTTNGFKINIKATMQLGLCFKPEIEDIKILGKVKPIIKIEGVWGNIADIAGAFTDEIKEAIEKAKKKILETIQEYQQNAPIQMQEKVKEMDNLFCLDDSMDALGNQASTALYKYLKQYNLH